MAGETSEKVVGPVPTASCATLLQALKELNDELPMLQQILTEAATDATILTGIPGLSVLVPFSGIALKMVTAIIKIEAVFTKLGFMKAPAAKE